MPDRIETKIDFHQSEYRILFESYHKKNGELRSITQIGMTGLIIVYAWIFSNGYKIGEISAIALIIPMIISYMALRYSIGLAETMDVDRLYLRKIEKVFSVEGLMGRENYFDSISGINIEDDLNNLIGSNKIKYRWIYKFKIWSLVITFSSIVFVSYLILTVLSYFQEK